MNTLEHFPQKLTHCTNAVQFVWSGGPFLRKAEIASACQSMQPWFFKYRRSISLSWSKIQHNTKM